MWPLILFAAAVAGAVYLARKAGDALGPSVTPPPPGPRGPSAPIPVPNAADWTGWLWPVPVMNGRMPVITQEWKPGADPVPGQASGEHTNHLGVDIMFRKLATDPVGPVKHDASKMFIAPPGTPIIAAGPGKIWRVNHSDFYGTSVEIDHGQKNGGTVTFYQHLGKLERDWQKGDEIKAGEIIGEMGYAPGDPEQLRHLHFELWFPRDGVPQNAWRIDPAPYMQFWKRSTLPEMIV